METSPWMTRDQAAAYLGLSKKTLDKWACTGDGPAFFRPSRRITRYHRAVLDAWLLQTSRRHTADDGTTQTHDPHQTITKLLAEAHALANALAHQEPPL